MLTFRRSWFRLCSRLRVLTQAIRAELTWLCFWRSRTASGFLVLDFTLLEDLHCCAENVDLAMEHIKGGHGSSNNNLNATYTQSDGSIPDSTGYNLNRERKG